MLSVASVKSASGAAEYFAKDDKHPADYYVGDGGSGPGGGSGEGGGGNGGDTGRGGVANTERTGWEGKGAELLGLSGEVTKDAFEKILNGELPNGDKIGQVQNRQSGIDLTFSMPKSASILALVSGDERILNAHWSAVKETMSWVEGKFAEGRTYERTKSGEPVKTGNLVYAMFAHDTSRALDPQAHIHVVIANLTRMANGAWQALHNGQLWKNNSVIGAAYHAAFREKLAELGYQSRITGKHGQFEINGVTKEAIDEFRDPRPQRKARPHVDRKPAQHYEEQPRSEAQCGRPRQACCRLARARRSPRLRRQASDRRSQGAGRRKDSRPSPHECTAHPRDGIEHCDSDRRGIPAPGPTRLTRAGASQAISR
jgi:conjugative relaxase-like TrwC/TraI family protein